MPNKFDLFADYLKIIDDIQELIFNNAELDFSSTIRAGESPNEIIVPRFVMDEPAEYSKTICGTVKIEPEIIQFKHNITPKMIKKGFTHFKSFINAFRRDLELEEQEVKPCQKTASE